MQRGGREPAPRVVHEAHLDRAVGAIDLADAAELPEERQVLRALPRDRRGGVEGALDRTAVGQHYHEVAAAQLAAPPAGSAARLWRRLRVRRGGLCGARGGSCRRRGRPRLQGRGSAGRGALHGHCRGEVVDALRQRVDRRTQPPRVVVAALNEQVHQRAQIRLLRGLLWRCWCWRWRKLWCLGSGRRGGGDFLRLRRDDFDARRRCGLSISALRSKIFGRRGERWRRVRCWLNNRLRGVDF